MPLRNEPLEIEEGLVRREALGLYPVEVLSILWIGMFFVVYLMVITIFGVIWVLLVGNIQGGFTTAGFFGSMLAVIGTVLAAFETWKD